MNKRINKLEDLGYIKEVNPLCRIVVFTGAGMSAESGISTFRDQDGLWESHKIEDVASIEAWHKDPELVLDFYNQRRRQLLEVTPNAGHLAVAELQSRYPNLRVITQNVDDLHERAAQEDVLHLHGQLRMSRSTGPGEEEYSIDGSELLIGDLCPNGYQLRPNIVWFGEMVPAFEQALDLVSRCDLLIVVGTSLAVYPAAGLLNYVGEEVEILLIDPKAPSFIGAKTIYHYPAKAAQGLDELARLIMP
jgi:NAD-dependent deacetylase